MAKRPTKSQTDRCRKALRKIAPDGISDAYIEKVVERMAELKERENAKGAKGNFKKAMGEFVHETRMQLAKDREMRAQNVAKNRARLNYYSQFTAGEKGTARGRQAAEGLLSKQGGGQQLKAGINDSVSVRRNTFYQDWNSKLTLGLEKRDAWKLFASDALEREIMMEMHEIGKPGARPGISGSPEAKGIADVLAAVQKQRLEDSRAAGLDLGEIANRIMPQVWEKDKVKAAGFELFRDQALLHLDRERTFSYDAGNPAKEEEFLRAAYKSITEGKFEDGDPSLIQTGDELITTANYAKLGDKLTRSRALHFKDGASFYEFNKLYGAQTLREATHREMRSNARNAALISVYGTDPVAAFQADKVRLRRVLKDDPAALKEFNNRLGAADNLWAQISGDANRPVNEDLAKWSAGARSLNMVASLGATAVRSFPDVATSIAVVSSQTGQGLGEVAHNFIRDYFKTLPTENRKAIGELIGFGIKDHLGEISHTIGGDTLEQVPGLLAKTSVGFMKLIGLDTWTETNKLTLTMQLAREGAVHSGQEFGALPAQYRANLQRYNIGEAQWNALRGATDKLPDGSTVIRPDLIYGLNEGADRKFLRETELNWKSYLNDNAGYGVPEPGDRVRARLNQGTRSGTIAGETMRFLGQFKAFPLFGYDIGLRVLASNPEKPLNFYRDALRGHGDFQRFTGMVVGASVMAYMADSILRMSANQQPLSPADPFTWKRALAQGGGFGFYGDLLLGEAQRLQPKGGLLTTLAGPTLTRVADATSIATTAAVNAQEGKDQTKNNLDAFNFLVRQAPGNNIFYLKTALDYAILDRIRNGIDPDYSDRKRARQEKRGESSLFDF